MWVVPWLAMVALKEFLLQKKEEKLSKPGQNGSKAKVARAQKKRFPKPKRQKRGGKKTKKEGGKLKEYAGTQKTTQTPFPELIKD